MHLNKRVCHCSSASHFLIFLGVTNWNDLACQLCSQIANNMATVFPDKRWRYVHQSERFDFFCPPKVNSKYAKIFHHSTRFPAQNRGLGAHPSLVPGARLQGLLLPLRGLWWAKLSHTARAKGFWVGESGFSAAATFKDQEAIQNTGTQDQRREELLLISRWGPCKFTTNYCVRPSH